MNTQLEIQYTQQTDAAEAAFLLAPEFMPPHFIYELIDGIDSLAAESAMAGEALRGISDEEYADYQESLSKLARGNQEITVVQTVSRVQGLLDQAHAYRDAVVAIRGSGVKLAQEVHNKLDPGFRLINNRPYWRGRDSSGREHLCTQGIIDGDLVYFGNILQVKKEEGRVATLEDFMALIVDVAIEQNNL